MKSIQWRSTSALLLILSLESLIPLTVQGFDGSHPSGPSSFRSDRGELPNFFSTLGKNYDLAFQKSLDKHSLLMLYYHDLSRGTQLDHLLSDAERRSESRILVRQALSMALQDTVEGINLLYTIKEYGRSLSSAELKVQDGGVSFSGPSMQRAGHREVPTGREKMRSRLMLLNNADFGLSLRTTMGAYQSGFSYFLAGGDVLGASLERELLRNSKLVLEYRVGSDESRALASLHFPFPF